YFGPEARSHSKSMRHAVRKVLVGILILFLLPLAVHAALYAGKDRPRSFRDADWSSVGMLPPADADRDARFLVFTGRTGRWEGIFGRPRGGVFQAGDRHRGGRPRRGRRGPAGAHQRWGAGRTLVRRSPARARRRTRTRRGGAHSKGQGGDRGLWLQPFRRLS